MDKHGTIFQYEPLWGAWRVDELISQSSNGEVYRVYKEEWGRRYISAVKLISLSIGKNDVQEAQAIGIDTVSMAEYFKSYVSSIVNEVEMMYRLRGNSNIVAYEDHSIHEKRNELGWDILIRMEYVQPLLDYMTVHSLTNKEIIKLGIDICEALEACAKESIIHRGIRDTSIFVSSKGDFKLGNFSIAKEVSKGGQAVPNRGNPLFMAPEIYKEQSYDPTVDTYSLGIVIYKLLNRGRLPFLPLPPHPVSIDDTENSIKCRMDGCEPELPADADEKLGRAILKACSYYQKDRYKSPAEFRQKLERISKAEGRTGRNYRVKAAAADSTDMRLNEAEAILSEIAVTADRMIPAAKQSKKNYLLAACCSGAIILVLGLMFGFSKPVEVKKPPMDTDTTTTQAHITPTAVPIPVGNTAPAEPTASPAPTEAAGGLIPADNGKAYFNKG